MAPRPQTDASSPERDHAADRLLLPGQGPEDDLDRLVALWVLREAGTPEDVAERVRRLAERFTTTTAEQSLDRLAELGLVRIASRTDAGPRYARTTLGSELTSGSLAPGTPLAAHLDELERLRTDLVATLAHELKTPLTAIRTCIGLLIDSDGRVEPEVRERLLSRVATSADSMQNLILNLLDLARYRAGNVPLEPRWLEAARLVEDASQLVAPALEAEGQALQVTEEAPDIRLYGDRRRLVQALGNVLSNAQKFSPPGAVIHVTVREAGGAVAWEIRDAGPGISEADRRHLFERFFRGRTDVEGGTGLGLPIALAAVQAHGGAITVESKLGEGSTFTVIVPRDGGAGLVVDS